MYTSLVPVHSLLLRLKNGLTLVARSTARRVRGTVSVVPPATVITRVEHHKRLDAALFMALTPGGICKDKDNEMFGESATYQQERRAFRRESVSRQTVFLTSHPDDSFRFSRNLGESTQILYK